MMASEITVIVCDHNFMGTLRKCYWLLRKKMNFRVFYYREFPFISETLVNFDK